MNTLLKFGSTVVVNLEKSHQLFTKDFITKEEFSILFDKIDDDDFLLRFFNPEYDKEKKEYDKAISLRDKINDIPFLSMCNDSIYWNEISPLSIPQDLVEDIIKAYETGNEKLLNSYKNFWILLSLNPSEECRKNLWWFLTYHGLVINSSGFFIAYRNAVDTGITDKDGNKIFTDAHSGSTTIKIGHTTMMPLDKCDSNSNHECSRGLHCASVKWLKQNYFGETGLVVIVNPAAVVATPYNSEYGKLRCCAYTPIDYCKFDDNGDIIPYDVESGFDCPYSAQAIYEGVMGTEEEGYKFIIPTINGVDVNTQVTDNLLNIAKEAIIKRNYQIINK